MKNKIAPFIHSNFTTDKYIITLYMVTIALIINVIYESSINNLALVKPLVFPLVGFLIGISIIYIDKKYIKKDESKIVVFNNFTPLFGVMSSLFISNNTNILIYIVITTIALLISEVLTNKLHLNILALLALIFLFIEKAPYYNLISIIVLIILYIVLFFTTIYKRNLVLIYFIPLFIILIIFKIFNIIDNINLNIFKEVLFFSIVIMPISLYSSYTKAGITYFSIITLTLTILFTFLIPISYSVLISIIITSFFSNNIDYLSNRLTRGKSEDK